MAVIRRNILNDVAARDKLIQGIRLLKQENSNVTTTNQGIAGPAQPVSTYDLFVIWHHTTMMRMTPPGNSAGRNAAHRGPIFLPWHRVMLLILERNLQRVLGDVDFGLPYWDWAADGDLRRRSKERQAFGGPTAWAVKAIRCRRDHSLSDQRIRTRGGSGSRLMYKAHWSR